MKKWLPAPPNPIFSLNEIHLWLAICDFNHAQLTNLIDSLSREETNKAKQFHLKSDRYLYSFSHGVLRDILSRYVQIPAKALDFETNQWGKPSLTRNISSIEFNLSSSQNFVLIAVSASGPVGVDIEFIRPINEQLALAKRYFTPKEILALKQVVPGKRLNSFYKIWTAKEAFIKAKGEGISLPFDQFSVAAILDNPTMSFVTTKDMKKPKEWSITQILISNHYQAALALKCQTANLTYWQWDQTQVD